MKVTNIIWDTDGFSVEELGLPTEVEVPSYLEEDEVADYLSDEYGFCIESLDYE